MAGGLANRCWSCRPPGAAHGGSYDEYVNSTGRQAPGMRAPS
ncbi:MAG: hypothetical protein ABIY55_01900 [Kofleriaceae bacterium]